MTVDQALHHLVELLPDPDAVAALGYVRWLLANGDTLSEEEIEEARLGDEEIARGEYVTLDRLERDLAGWGTRSARRVEPKPVRADATNGRGTASFSRSIRSRTIRTVRTPRRSPTLPIVAPRVGDYRIVFGVAAGERVVSVSATGPRGAAYRDL